MELVKIFIAGGVFCMFGEILWAKTGLGVVKTLMVCMDYTSDELLFSQVFRAYRVYHGHGGRTGIPVSRDQGEIAYHRGKTMRLPLSEIESGSL